MDLKDKYEDMLNKLVETFTTNLSQPQQQDITSEDIADAFIQHITKIPLLPIPEQQLKEKVTEKLEETLSLSKLDNNGLMIVLTSINILLPQIIRLIKPNELIGQPNGLMTHYIKKASNNHSEELKSSKNKKIKWYLNSDTRLLHIRYEDSKKKFTIYSQPLNTNAKKTFNFLLQKANQQHYPEVVEFYLEDYMDYTETSSKDYAYRQLKKDISKLNSIVINVEMYKYKKGKGIAIGQNEPFLKKYAITYNKCYFKCNPEAIKDVFSEQYTLIPYWTGKLKGKNYELVDYIFSQARRKGEGLITDGYLDISLNSMIEYFKLPEEDKKHYRQLVIVPMQKAVEEINNFKDNIDDIKIEIINDSVKTFYLRTVIKKEITEKMFPKKYYANKEKNS